MTFDAIEELPAGLVELANTTTKLQGGNDRANPTILPLAYDITCESGDAFSPVRGARTSAAIEGLLQ